MEEALGAMDRLYTAKEVLEQMAAQPETDSISAMIRNLAEPAELLSEHAEHFASRFGVCTRVACGDRVWKRAVLETIVYSVVPSCLRRRVIRGERVICATPGCGLPTTSPVPPMPSRRALYDRSFLAWLVTMKFVLRAAGAA